MVSLSIETAVEERVAEQCLDFNVIPKAADWLNVAGLVCSALLLLSYLVLPVQKTSRHYMTIGLVAAICLLQVCK